MALMYALASYVAHFLLNISIYRSYFGNQGTSNFSLRLAGIRRAMEVRKCEFTTFWISFDVHFCTISKCTVLFSQTLTSSDSTSLNYLTHAGRMVLSGLSELNQQVTIQIIVQHSSDQIYSSHWAQMSFQRVVFSYIWLSCQLMWIQSKKIYHVIGLRLKVWWKKYVDNSFQFQSVFHVYSTSSHYIVVVEMTRKQSWFNQSLPSGLHLGNSDS
jgi:hypothetical protein